MTPMMIAFAMDKKRRNDADAGKGGPAAAEAAGPEAPMMDRDEDEGGGRKRNCLYVGADMADLPAGEITATVKGVVTGEGADRRIEVAEVNGVKLPAGDGDVEAEDDNGAAMSAALKDEYGGGGDQEEA